MNYELIDSGNLKKFERFGDMTIVRPAPQAIWKPQTKWKSDLTFSREGKEGWQGEKRSWQVEMSGLTFSLMPTDFGHVGLFPEHHGLWEDLTIEKGDRFLNLFAYTGAASLFAAQKGAEVVHVDASKPSIEWAKKNAELNNLKNVRWILDDALKFCKREERRKSFYEGILLDPPTFGRGAKNEVFKIERDLPHLLETCFKLLSKRAKFLILSCHTPGYTPLVLEQLLSQITKRKIFAREMFLKPEKGFSIPVGACALWK